LSANQPAVLFSHIKSAPATSQTTVLFSHNKSAPAISHQPDSSTFLTFGILFITTTEKVELLAFLFIHWYLKTS